ncbi:hypothetical protein TARUN_3439 [Trichoderma arundinaceum]|uniref:Complex 1 LYR protein domain-containing protein n=1 Tax=Trichoderma arundinaceum TaxID=490622 RepID=A0A395NS80_TRIAR|nr:hypothetical protein TARUN_3439 [Trichoderma arundinaceum]
MRLSGLQKEVLALYRQCLRECRKKPQLTEEKNTRAHFEKFVRDEFSRNLAIDKRDFAAVEFLLRKGHRQLDVYSSPGIKDIRIRYRDSLPSTSFRRQRPKSRVVILSRRQSRAHTPTHPPSSPPVSPGSVYSSDAMEAPEQPYAKVHSHQAYIPPLNPSSYAQIDNYPIRGARSPYRGSSMSCLDAGSSLDHSWEPSELSVDLDSFPLPPVKDPSRQPRSAGNTSTTAVNPPRSHVSTLPKPGASTCFPRTSVSSPKVQRRSHGCMHRNPRSSHGWLFDGAADFANASKRASIDSALVEAISRSVCQQLRLFTAISKNNQDKRASQASREAPPSQQRSHERMPKRPDLLQKTFTERRRGRAKKFKAAGLAVTSKDQKRNFPAFIARLISSKSSRRHTSPARGQGSKVPRFDGFEDSSQSSMSEISFAPSQDMDEWRYAMIDEAPVRKQKRQPAKGKEKLKRRWFPCFLKDDESVADGE